jgi:hypothetical protein
MRPTTAIGPREPCRVLICKAHRCNESPVNPLVGVWQVFTRILPTGHLVHRFAFSLRRLQGSVGALRQRRIAVWIQRVIRTIVRSVGRNVVVFVLIARC